VTKTSNFGLQGSNLLKLRDRRMILNTYKKLPKRDESKHSSLQCNAKQTGIRGVSKMINQKDEKKFQKIFGLDTISLSSVGRLIVPTSLVESPLRGSTRKKSTKIVS
jgi:hypothetical protein